MSTTRNRRRQKGEETSYWLSYSDMMAGLLLTFVLIISFTMLHARMDYDEKQLQLAGKEEELVDLLSAVRISEKIKIAWYTGLDRVPGSKLLSFLDYLKVGHYDPKFGPLTSKTTNQKFYRVTGQNLEDCTSLFWKTNQI